MNTGHYSVQVLAEVCQTMGIRKVVFSPGSRSAPLVMAFSFLNQVERFIIPDERAAGYFALGMAQQTRETVALVCTSGTAVLNLLPATCEAFYQEIPLLIITADRPWGAEARGENQAINQQHIFNNYTVADIELDADKDTLDDIAVKTQQVLRVAQTHQRPVHINLHIDEPVYKLINQKPPLAITTTPPVAAVIDETALHTSAMQQLQLQLNQSAKKLVVVGAHFYQAGFIEKIATIAQRPDIAVLIETTSNANVPGAIGNYDTCLRLLNEQQRPLFVPDVVITFGNQVISKEIKGLLAGRYIPHWDITQYGNSRNRDYFKVNLPHPAHITEAEALTSLIESEQKESGYNQQWQQQLTLANNTTADFIKTAPFCDLTAFEILTRSYPQGANIQYGNSSPVRYSNFFKHHPSLKVNANRGTSGIDGCVSTAAGAARVNNQLTINVVGDVSFLYDSNALWNNYLSPNLRMVVINNSGGTIFRMILGDDTISEIKEFERFFETRHQLTAKHLADMYGLTYYSCINAYELDNTLPLFYSTAKPAILEIKTNGELSANVYKKFISQTKAKQ